MWLLWNQEKTLVEQTILVKDERKVCATMSSDGKDSGAIWQGPSNSSPDSLINQAQLSGDALSPLAAQRQEGGFHLSTPPIASDLEDADDPATPASRSLELIKQIGQYLTLILAPLLFGALTSLFVLPLIATGRASAPPESLWLVTFIIVVVTVAQGIAVYYAGSNNGLWALATVGGFFIFLLIGGFTIFGLLPGAILLVLILAVIVALARLYIHPVPEGFVDIVHAFGKYSRTLYPGFNILLPWEKMVEQLNVEETQWISPPQRVQVSRTEDVVLRGIISYQLMSEDAHLAVTQVKNWEEALRELFLADIQSIATTFSPDDFIAWPHGLQARPSLSRGSSNGSDGGIRWERINNYLYQQISDKVALCGVMIHKVYIRDVSLAPHGLALVDTDPVEMTPRVEEVAAQASASSTSGKAEAKTPKVSEQPQPTPSAPPATPPKMLKEDILIKAYKEVQSDKITDPQTIREIAARFEAIARDPKESQRVTFDPARAAQNLYEQAMFWEAKQAVKIATAPPASDAPKPAQEERRVGEDNLTAGG